MCFGIILSLLTNGLPVLGRDAGNRWSGKFCEPQPVSVKLKDPYTWQGVLVSEDRGSVALPCLFYS